MGKVFVEGGTFLIIVDPDETIPPLVTVPLPAIASHSLVVSSSADLVGKDATKKAVLKTDMEGQIGTITCGYTYGVYVTPGVLMWDGKLSGSQESRARM